MHTNVLMEHEAQYGVGQEVRPLLRHDTPSTPPMPLAASNEPDMQISYLPSASPRAVPATPLAAQGIMQVATAVDVRPFQHCQYSG